MPAKLPLFFARQAWVHGAWAHDVLLEVDTAGHWSRITPNASADQCHGATRLQGPVVPGVVNAHSHAFQRAMAGLTEQRSVAASSLGDDFWSWRDRMYSAALRITPDQLEHIAALLYAELLVAGYTQVCEFHYLHNAPPGQAPADPLDMSIALVRAAQKVGMGLTLLPTLYMRSGFGACGLRADQQRFASTPETIARLVDDLQMQVRGLENFNVGVALHSLRAADAPALQDVASFANAAGLPVHIHIAEQTQELQDCVRHTGLRPIEWALEHLPLNARWNLVHATHTTPLELQGVRDRGAAIVICPSTEANLGDGIFDYPGYAALGGQWSIGSDSHVTRSWSEELRLLEYSQRFALKRRNVAAQHGASTSTAANMFESILAGGKNATALPLGAIAVGQRADFCVLDPQAHGLLGVPQQYCLDALVFSSPDAQPLATYVAGQMRVDRGKTLAAPWSSLSNHFTAAMTALWSN